MSEGHSSCETPKYYKLQHIVTCNRGQGDMLKTMGRRQGPHVHLNLGSEVLIPNVQGGMRRIAEIFHHVSHGLGMCTANIK